MRGISVWGILLSPQRGEIRVVEGYGYTIYTSFVVRVYASHIQRAIPHHQQVRVYIMILHFAKLSGMVSKLLFCYCERYKWLRDIVVPSMWGKCDWLRDIVTPLMWEYVVDWGIWLPPQCGDTGDTVATPKGGHVELLFICLYRLCAHTARRVDDVTTCDVIV